MKLLSLPVVVPEFDVSPRLQNLPILQPGELGLRLALSLAGEDGGGADRPSDGLRSLNKLCWSWKRRSTESQIHWPRSDIKKKKKQCQGNKQQELNKTQRWSCKKVSEKMSECKRRETQRQSKGEKKQQRLRNSNIRAWKVSRSLSIINKKCLLYYTCKTCVLLQTYNSESICRTRI